ncbi:MAG: class I SAM-dependent methyltransferase [Anaerolineae bacterium]
MEFVTCNLCKVDASEPLFSGHDRLLGGTEIFQLVRCRQCGLIYLNPRPAPEEIGRYYPAEYEPFTRQVLTGTWYGRLTYRVAIAKRCRIASRGQSPGRLLDVGCGDGDFLLAMQRRGWEAVGVDISPVAVALARQKGLDVFQGQLAEAGLPEDSFDLVTMWDVLEHLHDPGAELARIARLLRPGGRLVATFPNAHSLDFRLFGPVWTGLDIPRHLYVFVRPALLVLFRNAGLEVISARCVTGGQRVSTWSLEWLIDDRLPGHRLNPVLKRVIYSRVWYWGWRPFYFLIDLLGWGSSITYTCRRPRDESQRTGYV